MNGDATPGMAPRDQVRVGRELLWGGLAALVSSVAAFLKVGGFATIDGVWGNTDFTAVYAGARALISQPWLSPNADLGFPYLQDGARIPTPDILNVIELKVLAALTGDPLVATNTYLVLSFAVVAASAYALFRVVRIPGPIAFALAVSLSLVPWHFARFVHVFLSNYSSVLLGLILVIAVLTWNLTVSDPGRGRRRDLLIVLGLAIYVGLSGAYYALFVTLLAVASLAVQVMTGRRGRGLIPAGWLAALPLIIAQVVAEAGVLFAVGPTPAAGVLVRLAEESQFYGGAIFTLVRTTDLWSHALPVPFLSDVPVAGIGNMLEPDANNSTLGVIAVILAFLACAALLVRNGVDRRSSILESLGYWPWLFVLSILFFVRSGFGQVVAGLLGYQVRAWGRLAIVVIAVALVILGLLIVFWLGRSRRPRAVGAGLVVAILTVTALDLASMPVPFDQAAATTAAKELRSYGAAIDAAVPEGCGVYQLPAYPFPEFTPTDGTATYDPLLPYLFSQHARWSFGGIRGTPAGDWHVTGVSPDTATLITEVEAAGFCAIQVDTRAEFEGDSPVGTLTTVLGPPVATSATGRWVLYALDS